MPGKRPQQDRDDPADQRPWQAALEAMQNELARNERELGGLLAQIEALGQQYEQGVAARRAELARLEAQIAEALARQQAQGSSSQRRATPPGGADRKQSGVGTPAGTKPPPRDPRRSALARLYRTVARRAHPDLATDGEQRALRTRLMVEANQAYQDGDEGRLRALLRQMEEKQL